MNSEIDLLTKIEAYLEGSLTPEGRTAFEQLRASNPAIDHKVVEHKHFMEGLSAYGASNKLKHELELIHERLDVEAIKKDVMPQPGVVITLWRKYKSAVAVAASVLIFVLFGSIVLKNKQDQKGTYEVLKREVDNIKRSQSSLIRNIKSTKATEAKPNPGQFGGTGFAISSNGYIVTNYHVVDGADSISVQNSKGASYKVKKVYVNPQFDIAILKVVDEDFSSFGTLPYTFKKINSDLGEDVYTIGYPRDDSVYGQGYLSSSTGFNGDTTAYQVSIPVNPGNSGGPLLDGHGNVIGIISGKQTQFDGAAFAIKSKFILKSINAIPSDSLSQRFNINKKNTLAGLNRKQQIQKLQDYIFMVRVYN